MSAQSVSPILASPLAAFPGEAIITRRRANRRRDTKFPTPIEMQQLADRKRFGDDILTGIFRAAALTSVMRGRIATTFRDDLIGVERAMFMQVMNGQGVIVRAVLNIPRHQRLAVQQLTVQGVTVQGVTVQGVTVQGVTVQGVAVRRAWRQLAS